MLLQEPQDNEGIRAALVAHRLEILLVRAMAVLRELLAKGLVYTTVNHRTFVAILEE